MHYSFQPLIDVLRLQQETCNDTEAETAYEDCIDLLHTYSLNIESVIKGEYAQLVIQQLLINKGCAK